MSEQRFVRSFLHSDLYHKKLLAKAQDLYEDLGASNSKSPTGDPEDHVTRVLAKSKTEMEKVKGSEIKVGIVFAMYNESSRLQPYDDDNNRSGENSILRKVESLTWLLNDSNADWRIYAVDDGCPNGSYDAAKQIVANHGLTDRVKILHLRDFVGSSASPLQYLRSVEDSMKGGSIIAGCIQAISDGCTHVCYTDSDNSVDLAQIGSYIYELSSMNTVAALGDRFLNSSFLLWWDSRREWEPIFATYIRRLLTTGIVPTRDIPCPLKMFSAKALGDRLAKMRVFDFAFDFDLLCQFANVSDALRAVDCVSVDSFEGSTWHSIGNDRIIYSQLSQYAGILESVNLRAKAEISDFVLKYINSPSTITLMRQSEPPEALATRHINEIWNTQYMPYSEMKDYINSLVQRN